LARGYFDKHQFLNLMDYILNAFSLQNAPVTDYRFCPHMPSDFCSCRKPQPGMIFDLAKTYQIDLGRSLLIGDNMSDILCGVSAGVGARFLISGNNAKEFLPESTTVCSNLAEVMNTLAFKNFLNF
jgi:D-glycero-D-manno-heptose 1,7-bisphosphate phosphatase